MTSADQNRSFEANLDSDDLARTRRNGLEDSEITPGTENGSESEDDAEGWLGTIGTDFRNLAACFKETIPPVIGGVANLVQKTAMSVAAEIAQLERDGEVDSERWREENEALSKSKTAALLLPWELKHENGKDGTLEWKTDKELMDLILSISLKEETFLSPFSPSSSDSIVAVKKTGFSLDENRITLIRRLLKVDDNLAAMHAKLSGRSDIRETVFWCNYFHHCDLSRNNLLERRKLEKAEATPADGDEKVSAPKLDILRENLASSSCSDNFSLYPASEEDESSYVVASAPNSLNTFTTTTSFEDLVLVGREDKK